MITNIPPYETGYRYNVANYLPHVHTRPVYDVRPSIVCTFHVMDTVCDQMNTQLEKKACRMGAVDAHTAKGDYSYKYSNDSAYRHGFFSTFSCPLQYNPYYS